MIPFADRERATGKGANFGVLAAGGGPSGNGGASPAGLSY